MSHVQEKEKKIVFEQFSVSKSKHFSKAEY